jgi:hypothetical protein
MQDKPENRNESPELREKFVEGRDYYFEDSLMVLTGRYLSNRGYCCESGCRHCPYGFHRDSTLE